MRHLPIQRRRSVVLSVACLFALAPGLIRGQATPDRVKLVDKEEVRGEILGMSPADVDIIDERDKEKRRLPIDQIVWVSFSGEPEELRAARNLLLRQQPAAALEELERLQPTEKPTDQAADPNPAPDPAPDPLDGASDNVRAEVAYVRAAAQARQAILTGTAGEAGEKGLREFLKNYPRSHHVFSANELLGELLVRAGRFDEALAAYAALDAGPPSLKVRGAMGKSACLYEQKKYAAAERQYADVEASYAKAESQAEAERKEAEAVRLAVEQEEEARREEFEKKRQERLEAERQREELKKAKEEERKAKEKAKEAEKKAKEAAKKGEGKPEEAAEKPADAPKAPDQDPKSAAAPKAPEENPKPAAPPKPPPPKQSKAEVVAQRTRDVAARQKREAQVGRARCLVRMGKVADAVTLLQGAIRQADPDGRGFLGRAYVALGDAHREAGKNQDAVLAFLAVDLVCNTSRSDSQAEGLLPETHAEALYNLVQLWQKLQNPERSREVRQSLETAYPQSRWAKAMAAEADKG